MVEADIDNDESDAESSTSILVTAREYGQTGNGALAEFVLKRQLGETAVARTSSKQSSEVSTVTSASVQPQMMLEPPAGEAGDVQWTHGQVGGSQGWYPTEYVVQCSGSIPWAWADSPCMDRFPGQFIKAVALLLSTHARFI